MPLQSIVSDDSPICLVGGARISEAVFERAKSFCNKLVAVDSGADFLLGNGAVPEVVLGDLDSLSDEARGVFADRLCLISEQSTTDFEKAVMRVSAPCLLALGFTGGRMDHLLSVLNVIVRYPDQPVVLVDEDDASFVAGAGTTSLALGAGTRISVMPVGGARAVTLQGVVWPFSDQQMRLDGFTSPSNAASGGTVTLTTSDPVLVTLPREQLAAALKAAVRAG